MEPFAVLADPVRRRIVELLATVEPGVDGVRGFWAARLEDLAAEVEGGAPGAVASSPAARMPAMNPLGPLAQIARTVRDVTERGLLRPRVRPAAPLHLRYAGVAVRQAPHLVHRHADGRAEWMAFFDDPEGRPLALHQVRAPSDNAGQASPG